MNVKELLPTYPCTEDLWDKLRNEKRPIVVYGMGNGADKLISRFYDYGIEIADFFASDGFVRGHQFHGKTVKSFSDIKSEYSSFVIVLSFASNRTEVLEMLMQIDGEYELYIPDMPVAGSEYFDRAFYNSNYNKIVAAMECLEDEASMSLYAAIVRYKLFGKMSDLVICTSSVDEMYSLLPCETVRIAVDAGAYNGDTAREMQKYFPNLKKLYAIEPDVRNFKKLQKFSEAECKIDLECINAAAWKCSGSTEFITSGNRNSSVSSTASHQHKTVNIPLLRLDKITDGAVDYIKYDVEGAEAEALEGSSNLITEHCPALLISLYHRSKDIFELVNYVAEKYPFYKLYLRRLWCVPAWELNLIAVKDN